MVASHALCLIVTGPTITLRNLKYFNVMMEAGIVIDLNDDMLLTEESEVQTAVRGVETALLWMSHVEDCLVEVKVGSNEVGCDFIFVGKNEIIKACNNNGVN